jgi:hypothetical protein
MKHTQQKSGSDSDGNTAGNWTCRSLKLIAVFGRLHRHNVTLHKHERFRSELRNQHVDLDALPKELHEAFKRYVGR